MQKEDLLRKIKIFATAVTVAFVILIVALIVQFGIIAHNNSQITDLQTSIEMKRTELNDINRENCYLGEDGEFQKDNEIKGKN